MELSYSIIKPIRTVVESEYVLNTVRKLDIVQYITHHTPEDYMKYIKNKCLPYFNSISKQLFKNHDGDIGYALLMAYYISSYSNIIFHVKTNFEHKIIHASNEVISYLEGVKKINDTDFYDAIDYYYSLYKMWSSPDLVIVNKIYNRLINKCIEYKINKNHRRINKDIKYLMKRMSIINTRMMIEKILQNYNHLIKIDIVRNILWSHIKQITEDIEHTILIMIAEFRIMLIPKLTSSLDRKDIYYKIDTENILRDIRNNKFTPAKINDILNIFVSKIKKLYPKYNIKVPSSTTWTDQYYHHIVEIFRSMYDKVCM